jgi:hypothetical protein
LFLYWPKGSNFLINSCLTSGVEHALGATGIIFYFFLRLKRQSGMARRTIRVQRKKRTRGRGACANHFWSPPMEPGFLFPVPEGELNAAGSRVPERWLDLGALWTLSVSPMFNRPSGHLCPVCDFRFLSITNCPNRVNFRHRTTKWPNSLHSLFRQNW